MDQTPGKSQGGGQSSGAQWVAAGILLSRLAGLVRERVFAHYFGNSDAGDAFKAALKIPNFLQNLFGEGVLSASFIPVYAGLVAEKKSEEASRVASAVFSILALVVATLVAAGVTLTPWMIDLIAPGFQGEKRALTIRLVEIFFPGTGLLVLSAWCLGILNSHRRFFLSYAAPVLWNAAIVAALVWGGRRTSAQVDLAIVAAWGLVLGSALQFIAQLPTAWRLVGGLRPALESRLASVRMVVRNFLPVVVSRGVVQVSAYVDNMIASFLPTGAVSSLAYAQTLYLLPVSLFGMSISAAELPRLSSATGTADEIAAILRGRMDAALNQIAFFIIPSVVAFLVLGDRIVALLYQTGAFGREQTVAVWIVLVGSTIGLLSATWGRIYSSAYYALKDTRAPLRFALIRVALTTVLGVLAALYAPKWLGLPETLGTAGLTASAGMAGWIEFMLLRRGLNARIGRTGASGRLVAKLWAMAFASASLAFAAGLGLARVAGFLPGMLSSIAVIGVYGAAYLGLALAFGVPQAGAITRRLRRG